MQPYSLKCHTLVPGSVNLYPRNSSDYWPIKLYGTYMTVLEFYGWWTLALFSLNPVLHSAVPYASSIQVDSC